MLIEKDILDSVAADGVMARSPFDFFPDFFQKFSIIPDSYLSDYENFSKLSDEQLFVWFEYNILSLPCTRPDGDSWNFYFEQIVKIQKEVKARNLWEKWVSSEQERVQGRQAHIANIENISEFFTD